MILLGIHLNQWKWMKCLIEIKLLITYTHALPTLSFLQQFSNRNKNFNNTDMSRTLKWIQSTMTSDCKEQNVQ